MARQLRNKGYRLLTMSRHPNPELEGAGVEQWAVDLAQPEQAARRLHAWVAALPRGEIASLCLINNAAGLATLADLGDIDAADLSVRAARRPGGADAAERGLSQRQRRPRRTAQAAQHLLRPGPLCDGGKCGLLCRESRARPPEPRHRIGRSGAAERREDRLAGPGRGRYRHATATAHGRPGRLCRGCAFCRPEGCRAGWTARKRPPPRCWRGWIGPTSAATRSATCASRSRA